MHILHSIIFAFDAPTIRLNFQQPADIINSHPFKFALEIRSSFLNIFS